MSKKYQTTKSQCQEKIDKVIDGVCGGCGGKVTPLETVDNSGEPTYWAGCEHCSIFTYPVSVRLYKTAQALLDDHEYVYEMQPYKATDDELSYWRDTESRALCNKIDKYVKAYEANL